MRRVLAAFALVSGVALWPCALAAPRAQTTSGKVTYIARPGALVAQKGGREMWRNKGLFREAQTLEVLVSGGKLLVLSSEGKSRRASLTAFAPGTGKRLWQTPISDEDSTDLDLRGVTAGTVLVTAVWGPPRIPRVIVAGLEGGEIRFKKPGELLGYTGKYAVLLDYGLNLEVPTGAWLPLVRLDLEQARRTYIGLTLPERPGCGKVLSRQAGKSNLKYDNRFVTALRQDDCGLFTAKVDWYGKAGQTPIINPPRGR